MHRPEGAAAVLPGRSPVRPGGEGVGSGCRCFLLRLTLAGPGPTDERVSGLENVF
jgi:hypothetical protein